MVSSHRPAGFAGGAALLPVYGWDFLSSYSAPRWETRKTRRGRREVGRRRYAGYERKTTWFPLIDPPLAAGVALLPVYGWDFPSSHSAPRWETRKTRRGRREVGRRATRVDVYGRKPNGLLIARPASPAGLRPP